MTGANHDWGTILSAPLNGQWCRKCGYPMNSAYAVADCPGHPSGRDVADWSNDAVAVASAQQSFISEQQSASVSALQK